MILAALVAVLSAGAQAPADSLRPTVTLQAYTYKALRGEESTDVEFGGRIVATSPLAFGSSVPFIVSAEVGILSQAAEVPSFADPDVSLVKGIEVLLLAKREVGSIGTASTRVFGAWGFSSPFPGAGATSAVHRYGVGLEVVDRAGGASGRVFYGRDQNVGPRARGQISFEGEIPLASDRALIGGIAASMGLLRGSGRDVFRVWVGTDVVALIKRVRK
jgi:hypothetical protein